MSNTKDQVIEIVCFQTMFCINVLVHEVPAQKLVLRPARTMVKILGTHNVHESYTPSFLSGKRELLSFYMIVEKFYELFVKREKRLYFYVTSKG